MRRHELDPVSLTFGFAFTGLGLLFLLGRADQALRLHWVWPILLLVLGVGILADLARGRDSTEDEKVPTAPAPGRDLASDPVRDPTDGPPPEPAGPEGTVAREPEEAVDSREHPV
jgi:hypothetical protein